MPTPMAEQETLNGELVRMGKKLGIPLVATNDCHYVNRADAAAHDVLMAIQTGKSLKDEKRLKHVVDSYYMKSPAEMDAAFKDVSEAIENTAAIAANLPNARLRTRSMPLSDRRARRARPVLAARRPPWMRRASLATRVSPTRSPARHARPPPPGGAGVGAHPRGAAAVGATPTRRRADAGEALDMHFSLALACHLGKLTTEFVSRVDGS